MVCATVEMLSLTRLCCPFLAAKSRKRSVSLLQVQADYPLIDCFMPLTFQELEGLCVAK
jgi:hypothetical protein